MLSSVEKADEGAYSCRMSSDEVSTTNTMLYVIGEYAWRRDKFLIFKSCYCEKQYGVFDFEVWITRFKNIFVEEILKIMNNKLMIQQMLMQLMNFKNCLSRPPPP